MTLVTECSDGLGAHHGADRVAEPRRRERVADAFIADDVEHGVDLLVQRDVAGGVDQHILDRVGALDQSGLTAARSAEHTSELQSLMRKSYAVFCLKKKNNNSDK